MSRESTRRIVVSLAAAVSLTTLQIRAATIDVYVYSFDFSLNPQGQPIVDAIITVGDSVRWVWQEGNHTTTSVAGIPEQWDASINSNATTFSHTFANLGTWHYYCRPHGFDNGDQTAGGMSGTITVMAAGSGACCLSNGTCTVTSPANCAVQNGAFEGNGTTCTPNPCANQPVTVTLAADRDNVLHEDPNGTIGNGAGRYLYTGNQTNGLQRRSDIHFNVNSIPYGATIQNVDLRLFCNQTQGAAVNVALHQATADWGEGTSDPNGDEGSGATATTNDATWRHRFYNTVFWATPGGDFAAAPSATLSVGTSGVFHTWNSPDLIADVQSWIDVPGTNFGWIIRGDEASSANTKRFASRQTDTPPNAPQLVITYLPVGVTGACCLPDASCASRTATQCAAQGGSYQGDNTSCASVSCSLVLTPFVDPLPLPAVAQPVTGVPGGAGHYQIAMTELTQLLHRDLPLTRVWGYGGSYPGPTIEARRDLPVTVTWVNDLRDVATGQLRTTHVLPVDTCLHGPDVTGQVPVAVVHLHGGHVAVDSDGYPETAFPPGQQSSLYTYPNHQPAATIWYHDHALGITRLNVYMGLAGFYLIRDAAEDALNIPRGEYEIPLAIQDRSFNADGSLRYLDMWHDHFFGDKVLVNGKVWPYLNVKKGKYRFRMLNGSSSRAYTLALSNGATFWQIGSDTGLLSAPVAMTSRTLVPGERADVVIDFSAYATGTEILLTNSAPAPFPSGPAGSEIPEVMKFVVQSAPGDTDPLPLSLVPVPRTPESDAVAQRDFELAVMPDAACPEHHDGMWMINGLMWDDITEFPVLGTTEVWAWVNRSAVTHPMHMHLVSFQILDRQDFDPATGQTTGSRVPPPAYEMGWKDTVQAYPSQITRVIAKFEDYTGLYPYHCHILEHEDNEMMRQFRVVECLAHADCEDGQFCNGAETCQVATYTCQPGLPPNCADAVACTIDACDEATGSCTHTTDDAVCDNGLFCDGAEFCDAVLGCKLGVPPCGDECERCDEGANACDWCLLDLDYNAIMGTGDFALFAGCFGGCYVPADLCFESNFDASADGCVGTSDFAGFAGCFGDACTGCAACAGPSGAAAARSGDPHDPGAKNGNKKGLWLNLQSDAE